MKHECLVHTRLWESLHDFLYRNPTQRLPSGVIALTLHRLFLALDYLHSECQIVHTGKSPVMMPFPETCNNCVKSLDIRGDNIMFGLNYVSVLENFERQELSKPSPRKEENGGIIYMSRELETPAKVGAPILCDFGSAVSSDTEHTGDVQPDTYRAPEVILEVPWTSRIDIWNVGCLASRPFAHRRKVRPPQV